MGVPYVTSFCCCMDLELGAKCVGYLHLITAISMTIVCSLFTSNVHSAVGTVEDAGDHLYLTWFIIGLVVSIVSVVHCMLACLLLVATYKRNTCLLRTWVIVMAVLACAALVYVISSAALGFSSTGSHIFLAFAEGFIFFAVVAYCIVCVNSYYMMLKSTEDMEGPAKTDC